jgi:hypothetical protein
VGPVVRVLLGEMFPNRIRAAALAVAASAQWPTNWPMTISFPTLPELSLSGTRVGCTVFVALSIYFGWKWIPGTEGRTPRKRPDHFSTYQPSWRKGGSVGANDGETPPVKPADSPAGSGR